MPLCGDTKTGMRFHLEDTCGISNVSNEFDRSVKREQLSVKPPWTSSDNRINPEREVREISVPGLGLLSTWQSFACSRHTIP